MSDLEDEAEKAAVAMRAALDLDYLNQMDALRALDELKKRGHVRGLGRGAGQRYAQRRR